MSLCGWAGKILNIDLSTNAISTCPIEPYTHHYLGGRALAARLAWEELPAGADAFDPENLVIIATGPLTGTLVPTAGRTVMASISPRVYPRPWYTHSTLGGWFGAELKYAGYDAIVIRGRARQPVYIRIKDGQVDILDAGGLWGLDAFETQQKLRQTDLDTQVMAIGPAGENLVRFATVQHAEENAAGHSGFGAVWGSKNLKAISVRGTGSVKVAHPEMLLNEILSQGTGRPSIACNVLWEGAKNRKRPICSQSCTFNCLASVYTRTIDEQLMPGQCIGGLNWVSDDSLRATEYHGGGVNIPPSKNFGRCEEASLHERCNRLGLDLWFRIVMQPWFHRCVELGVTSIRGFALQPDDLFWFDEFMRDLAYRRNLGSIFAEDLCRAMETLQNELPEELIELGHRLEFDFGFPAHREGRFWDVEPFPFWVIAALMYATESRDPTIGTHNSAMLLADFLLMDRQAALRQFAQLGEQVWGEPEALALTLEHKSLVALWTQHSHMLIDTLPLCDFAFPELVRRMDYGEDWKTTDQFVGDLDYDLRVLHAVTGKTYTRDGLEQLAERACTLERALLARFGRTRRMEDGLWTHFQLPCRTDGTLIDREGFIALLDEFLELHGWDRELGWPSMLQLEKLHLQDLCGELEQLRTEVKALARD